MRALMVALILLLVAPEVMADRATGRWFVWEGRQVTVYDRSSPEWRPEIEQTVTAFNAVMPNKAPRLVYRAMPQADCAVLPIHRLPKNSITFCSVVTVDFVGRTLTEQMGRSMTRVMVQLTDPPPGDASDRVFEKPACHEMMHAMTAILDNPGALPDTSCVWGELSSPGPFDAAYIERTYRKFDQWQHRHSRDHNHRPKS